MALKKVKSDLNAAVDFAEHSKLDFSQLSKLQSVQRLKQLASRSSQRSLIQPATPSENTVMIVEDPLQLSSFEGSSPSSPRVNDESSNARNGQMTKIISEEASMEEPPNNKDQKTGSSPQEATSTWKLKHKGVISLVCVTLLAVLFNFRAHPFQIINFLIGAKQRDEVKKISTLLGFLIRSFVIFSFFFSVSFPYPRHGRIKLDRL